MSQQPAHFRRPFLNVMAAVLPTISACQPPPEPPATKFTDAELLAPELTVPTGLGPKLSDRASWEKANLDRAKILAEAEQELPKPIPALRPEDFQDYAQSGNRDAHGKPAGERWKRIGLFGMAAGITGEQRFVDAAQREAQAIVEEPTWIMPAHDPGLRNFRGETTEIDLGSAMRALQLSTIAWWLDERWPAEFNAKLKAELRRRIVEPYERFRRGENDGVRPLCYWTNYNNNWIPVCYAGIVAASLYTADDPREVREIVEHARAFLPRGFKSHTEDGYCTEGIMYHNYGFGHYAILAEMLYRASGGEIDLFREPKAAVIAPFPTKFEIISQRYPAFGDTPYGSGASKSLQTVLAHRLGAPGLLQPAMRASSPEGFSYILVADTISAATMPPAGPVTDATWRIRDEFPAGGLLICRPSTRDDHRLAAAFKAGHNGEAHNHNDEGTFVIVTGESMPVADIGSEVYTASTFSGERYRSAANNSYGHNVPVLDGQLQIAGAEAAARIIDRDFTPERDRWVVDLSACYNVPGLKKLEREFIYHRGEDPRVEVIDRVSFDRPAAFGTALMTLGEWEQQKAGRLVIRQGEGAVTAEIISSVPYEIRDETLNLNLSRAKTPARRIGVNLGLPVKEAELKMVFRPVKLPSPPDGA